ncbi:MAG: hypothetical protein HYX40_06375 [Sphingobacteriales bacterium]|nr:hypothetical protein [Sphingobacteriales bacterium]
MNDLTGIRSGTAGGTLTIIIANITGTDLLKTSVLAAIGAIVSYSVSYLLKRLTRKRVPPEK